MKNNACKRISTDQKAQSTEQLSSRSQPRWIENLSRIYQPDRKFLDGSRIYLAGIEIESQESRWIEIAITFIEKRSSRGSIDSLAVKRYRDCLKTVFQRIEKYRHECNQTSYLTKYPNSILNSQKHLSSRKMLSI